MEAVLELAILLLIPLFPLSVAFFSGALQAKQIYVDADDGLRDLALILFLAIALAMVAVVIPYWASRESDCYMPSIMFQVLVYSNLVLLVISKLVAKFGQERDSVPIKSVGASAMLAISFTLPLMFVFQNLLAAYFNITFTP